MTNEFTVVGKHREDSSQLLVVGADGNYYGYSPAREQVDPVEPDDHWVISSNSDEIRDEGSEPELDMV